MSYKTALLLTALAVPNLTFSTGENASVVPERFVSGRGQSLIRSGREFRFVGVNCYRLAEYTAGANEILATLAAHRVKVVRFWAFQKYCGQSGCDFAKFDRLVAAAKRHDILLLPVLENHWIHCTYSDGGQWKPREWYDSGWKADRFGNAPLSYHDYVQAIGTHFRQEPQILGWQLVNEPEIYPDTDENHIVLRQFAVEAADELKQIDPNHLVSLGLLGLGQPSTAGKQFRRLNDCAGIDLVTAHDHGYMSEPLAGRDWPRKENSFYGDICGARSLQKPFVASESGIAMEWVGGDHANRAKLFDAKLRAFFAAGGSGYILWNYEPTPDTDYGFGPDDPVMQVITDVAALL